MRAHRGAQLGGTMCKPSPVPSTNPQLAGGSARSEQRGSARTGVHIPELRSLVCVFSLFLSFLFIKV